MRIKDFSQRRKDTKNLKNDWYDLTTNDAKKTKYLSGLSVLCGCIADAECNFN